MTDRARGSSSSAAGSPGCSVAYHLAEAGWTDVLLVEKASLTAGSTCQAAGLVTAFNPSSTMMALRRYSIELYGRLGVFERVGSLRLASSPEQLARARADGEPGARHRPGRRRHLGRTRRARLMPAISPESLYGAVYLTGDGYLDPHAATHAVADAARALGVRIRTGHAGDRLRALRRGARSRASSTDAGPIDTELVVNAAGMWAPQVAAMVGAFIPSTPVDHQHIALKAVPGHELPHDMPCFRDPDNLVYGKSEHGGMVFGGYEAEPVVALGGRRALGARRRVAAARLRAVRAAHGGRHPPLPVPRRCRGDPPRLPPRRDDARREPADRADARRARLLGRRRAVAQRVRRWRRDRAGARRLDHGRRSGRRHRAVPGVAVRRHVPRSAGSRRASLARPTRDYYRLRYPYDADVAGRPRRLSPLHGRLAGGRRRVRHEGRLGAGGPPSSPGAPWRRAGRDQAAYGWARPPWFERVGEEHRAVRERVGIIDLSSFGKIDVDGPGALGAAAAGLARTTSTGPSAP